MSWSGQIWIKCNSNFDHHKQWDKMKDWGEVESAWSTMGDWDVVLNVKSDKPENLEHFVLDKLRKENWVQDTRTWWTNQVWSRAA